LRRDLPLHEAGKQAIHRELVTRAELLLTAKAPGPMDTMP
jgi:hypothetical protein